MKSIIKGLLTPFSTFTRSYKILLIMTALVPILVGIYIMTTMSISGITFSDYLYQDGMSSIQFLVSLVDLVWFYILYVLYQDFKTEGNQQYIGFTLWIMLVSQIILINPILAVITGITIYKMGANFRKSMNLRAIFYNKFLSTLIFSLMLFSLICGFALIGI